jgi:hypothetical protein
MPVANRAGNQVTWNRFLFEGIRNTAVAAPRLPLASEAPEASFRSPWQAEACPTCAFASALRDRLGPVLRHVPPYVLLKCRSEAMTHGANTNLPLFDTRRW